MRRLPSLSTPPLIAIADEPLDDGHELIGAARLPSIDGFEIVPAWHARPPRRLRWVSAAAPLMAVAVAVGLWVLQGNDPSALRERPAAASASKMAATHALVVSAAPARAGSLRFGR